MITYPMDARLRTEEFTVRRQAICRVITLVASAAMAQTAPSVMMTSPGDELQEVVVAGTLLGNGSVGQFDHSDQSQMQATGNTIIDMLRDVRR